MSISENEIKVGQPVRGTTLKKVKVAIENHEDRITSLEGGGNTVYAALVMSVNGTYGEPGDFSVDLHGEGVLKTTTNFNMIITGVRLIVDKAGLSGSTEIDLKYKRASAPYTSIFSTKPSVGFASGDDATSTNGVVNTSLNEIRAGDILRLDVTSVQHRAKNFIVRIDYYKE